MEYKMVLVEEGPWKDSVEMNLARIQDRLYGCVDAALDGQLAAQFPEALGKTVVISIDCYDVPVGDVREFFERFSKGIFQTEDYAAALKASQFVTDVRFEIGFGSMRPFQ